MPLLLLLRSEVEEDGGAGREGRGLEPGRVLVTGQLGVEHPLVRGGESLAAVVAGEADAGQAGVEEHPLNLPLPGHGGQLLLVVPVVAQWTDRDTRGDRAEVVTDECPGPLPEGLEVLRVEFAHGVSPLASTRSARR